MIDKNWVIIKEIKYRRGIHLQRLGINIALEETHKLAKFSYYQDHSKGAIFDSSDVKMHPFAHK